MTVFRDPKPKKLRAVADVFEKWLARYGDSGVRKMQMQKQDEATSTSSTIDTRTKNTISEIVKRRGLLEGVFTPEQLSQLGNVKVTGRLDDQIRDAWDAYKRRER